MLNGKIQNPVQREFPRTVLARSHEKNVAMPNMPIVKMVDNRIVAFAALMCALIAAFWKKCQVLENLDELWIWFQQFVIL